MWGEDVFAVAWQAVRRNGGAAPARGADFAAVQQRLHAPFHSGLEGAGVGRATVARALSHAPCTANDELSVGEGMISSESRLREIRTPVR